MSNIDTNQASEDEMRENIDALLERWRNILTHKGDGNGDEYYQSDVVDDIQEIIRTEKLELLAEVRELLIDRIPVYDGDDSFGKEYQAGYNSMAHATRTMQLQQSAELTKLEAEL